MGDAFIYTALQSLKNKRTPLYMQAAKHYLLRRNQSSLNTEYYFQILFCGINKLGAISDRLYTHPNNLTVLTSNS
jgi:hypothetical protein